MHIEPSGPDQHTFPYWASPPCTAAAPDFSFLHPLKPTVVFTSYVRFAAERQRIFFRRLRGDPPPWTADPILQQNKFTNAYRAADRVSQYLIRKVIYGGDSETSEVCFRILLFKIFNRIDTWTRLEEELGEICWRTFKFATYERALSRMMAAGKPIYSPAYIMPSGGRNSEFRRKHEMHLRLVERMMKDDLPGRLGDAQSMENVFRLLQSYPSIGGFLAYQFSTDLNYSNVTDFDEMKFVVPGPGAMNGIRKCFADLGGMTETDAIKKVADHQEECFAAVQVEFPSLWGRRLQLIDCQNLFCEVDKYARVKHPEFNGLTTRVRIKQKFRPSSEPLAYWFPPKWKLNDLVQKGVPDV